MSYLFALKKHSLQSIIIIVTDTLFFVKSFFEKIKNPNAKEIDNYHAGVIILAVNLGTKILLARREINITQTDLARRAGLQPSYISQIESGKRTPTLKNIQKIAKALTKSLDYFAEDSFSIQEGRAQHSSLKQKPIPVISYADAGKGQEYISDYPVGNGFDTVSRSFAESDPGAYAIQIMGDSMEPRLHPKDIVIASPIVEVINNDDAIIRIKSGEVFVKRVKIKKDGVILKSYNSQMYDDITVKRKDVIAMHKVVGIIPK